MEINMPTEQIIEIVINFERIFQKRLLKMEENTLFSPHNENFDIYQKEYHTFEMLNYENKPELSNFDETSDYYYINRNTNVNKPDVIKKQRKFYEVFNSFLPHFISQPNDIITTKSDFEKLINKTFSYVPSLTKDRVLLRFLKELWLCLKLNNSIDDKSIELDERMKLSFYEISKRTFDHKDFELHKAVFENNLRSIRKICAFESTSHIFCDINDVDSNGNTPLILAIKLKHLDAINVLCDHEADIKLRSFDTGYSALEHAIHSQDKSILKILINAQKKQKISHWDNSKHEVLKMIKSIPDFSMDLKLNFDSSILALFSSITPCDYYKIQKKGGNLRVDMNISRANSMKGKSSILIQEKGNNVNIYRIDHQKKTSFDYIDALTNNNDEEKKIKKLLGEGLIHNKIFTKNISLTECVKQKEEKIANYPCHKYISSGTLYITKEKQNTKNILISDNGLIKNKYNSFGEYFQDGLRQLQTNRNMSQHNLRKSDESILPKKKQYSNNEYEIEYIEKLKKKKNIKINKKPLNMSVWLSDSFPIKLNHFLPLVHILSFTSSEFSRLKSTICSNLLPFDSFPLRVSFPLGMSFYALLSVTGFTTITPLSGLFELSYQNTDENKNDVVLDEKYAQNFYENYYKEKNINTNSKEDDQSSLDEGSDYFKQREIFFTNTEEDAEYMKYSNMSSQRHNMEAQEQICRTIENSDKNFTVLTGADVSLEEDLRSNGLAKIAIMELNRSIQKRKKKMGPISIKNESYNFNSVTNHERGLYSISTPIFTETTEQVGVPNENGLGLSRFIIPCSTKIRHKSKPDTSSLKKKRNDSDLSQKTLKCNIKPKIIKNFRNFYKYESNCDINEDKTTSKVTSHDGKEEDKCLIF